ncbi:DUF885 domain-containing protein [Hymenobacter sp. 15J16-1T3B]|uniref:DUF885 domain-containing protein n=1 Tax=Hymenobacter sp. 15J16-1T3B TaxID=2886941 RepID=UPI001D125C9E|nr:DUF885 domain-containing protein [Hymenobacter sp. 15J16-1T3B]MCC3159914.1 DUF885 domain-containing protein [Hymenobacter sp. 15J16-1T3B]
MKYLLIVFAACWSLGAGAQPPRAKASGAAAARTTETLAALLEQFNHRRFQLYPLTATAWGDHQFDDQLPNDQTQAFRDTVRSFYRHYRARLRRFDRARLSATDQVSYDILDYELTQRLQGFAFNNWMMPFNQFVWSLTNTLPIHGSGKGAQPFKTVADYDRWLARLHHYPVLVDSAIGNFRRGMRAGVVLPKAVVARMVPQLRAMVVTDPTKSLFYGPIAAFPADFSAADQARLTALYQEAIRRDVVAPYQKLADFLETEYLPRARSSAGYGALPQGAARYAYAVQTNTTTTLTPEQIHRLGLAEVARIRAEMERVKARIGFAGDLNAYFEFVRTDPQFRPFQTQEQVLEAFRAVQARIAPALPRMFGRVPKSRFEVRATEAFRAASAAPQYSVGDLASGRPGVFYVPILDPLQFNVAANPAMETLFLHEAIPGHHFQLSLQQENPDLSAFRRMGGYAVFAEGWGLYAESLGPELGLFTDLHQLMGHLGNEIHRALRLVIDTGLHTGTFTREQAIAYMMANEPISEQAATAEVERYMAVPGQALSYKIGQLKLSELRARYEKQLGPKFSLRAFHDEILLGGSMPLTVLEKRLDAWAAGVK